MKCYKCGQDTYSYICRQCEREESFKFDKDSEHLANCGKVFTIQGELEKAIKEKEKRDEEYSGDDHEFYESCYVPERDC